MQISISRGMVALIDEQDAQLVGGYKWFARPCPCRTGLFYAVAHSSTKGGAKRQTIYMHRLIIAAEPSQLVDHINCDGLDNRRSNLRLATHADNSRNRRYVKSSTGYRGVIRNGDRFRAALGINGKMYYFGSYGDPISAAKAYDMAASAHFGEFAKLNFQREI